MTDPQPLYVTGADARYARCLHQLFGAAHRKGWTRDAQWVVYDLGMTLAQRTSLTEHFPWLRWETLDFETLPSHYPPHHGNYAWKPEVIWREVAAAQGPVIWMDSANIPLARPDAMLAHVRDNGLYLLRGQAPIQERCNPEVLDRLGAPRWTWGMRECVTGIVGLDATAPRIRALVEDWANHARDLETIRPTQRIERHMNDQAVMNALIAGPVCRGEIVLPEEDVDISSGRPTRLLSTRNKLKPDFPLWAGFLARAYYRLHKRIDQFLYRLDDFHLDHNPFWRMYKEEFILHYKTGDGPTQTIKAPFGHYYADPFLIEENGILWAFFEDLNYFDDRAALSALPLIDPQGRTIPVLDPGVHTSFPFLFRHEGDLYMLPETGKNGRLELWRCSHFPAEWQRHRVILWDVNAADSVLFEHDGRFWLLTFLESPCPGGMYRYLAIFHSDDPVNGDWIAHPINEKGHDVTARGGTGRNAGGVFHHEGRLLRAVQDSTAYYGEGMAFREIVTLTPEAFEERPAETPSGLEMSEGEGVHHLTRLGDTVIWDQRTRH